MARPKKAAKTIDEDFDDNVPQNQNDQIAKIGGNIAGLHDDIRASKSRIDQWKKERKAINDKIKAERETMEAKGMTKNAFDDAMAYIDATPDKREGYDTAYIICREALGAPVKGAQADLFGMAVAADETVADDE